jgi:hypothetical protein
MIFRFFSAAVGVRNPRIDLTQSCEAAPQSRLAREREAGRREHLGQVRFLPNDLASSCGPEAPVSFNAHLG